MDHHLQKSYFDGGVVYSFSCNVEQIALCFFSHFQMSVHLASVV